MTSRRPFAEVYAAEPHRPRTLLYGNGLSVALHPEFSYSKLRAPLVARLDPELQRAVGQIPNVDDVETLFLAVYQETDRLAREVEKGNRTLRDAINGRIGVSRRLKYDLSVAMLDVLLDLHARLRSEVTPAKLDSACAFLRHFDRLLTLNYDLLWFLIRERCPAVPRATPLHGALHILSEQRLGFFGPGWNQMDVREIAGNLGFDALVEKIRALHREKEYPALILETIHLSKADRVELVGECLGDGYSLAALRGLRGSLYTFGWSAAIGDQHIFEAIADAPALESIYLGAFSERNVPIYERRIKDLRARRVAKGLRPVHAEIYDSRACLLG